MEPKYYVLIFVAIALAVGLGLGLGLGLKKNKKGSGSGGGDKITPFWVAAGNDGAGGYSNLMYSTDGKTWTDSSGGASFSRYGEGVAYGKGSDGNPLWVAGGMNSSGGYSNLMYSTDGKTWTKSSGGASFSGAGRGVASNTLNPALA